MKKMEIKKSTSIEFDRGLVEQSSIIFWDYKHLEESFEKVKECMNDFSRSIVVIYELYSEQGFILLTESTVE